MYSWELSLYHIGAVGYSILNINDILVRNSGNQLMQPEKGNKGVALHPWENLLGSIRNQMWERPLKARPAEGLSFQIIQRAQMLNRKTELASKHECYTLSTFIIILDIRHNLQVLHRIQWFYVCYHHLIMIVSRLGFCLNSSIYDVMFVLQV